MIHILTSTSTILKVEVRPQESRIGDSNVKATLNLQLKKAFTKESFSEQQDYLQRSAIAAYVSLNKLDQRKRFRGGVNFIACNEKSFNFTQGSSSSGLGYALACFDAWWRISLNKRTQFNYPVFATGEVLTSGQISSISQIHEKIESLCQHVEENKHSISNFYFCYPYDNDKEIPTKLKDRLIKLGGMLISSARLQQMLSELLGENYDGDPLGRWLPFKGLNSFDYEDSVRFFGRENEVEGLYKDIIRHNGLFIVSGSSCVGKTSLIKAGVIPKVEKESGGLSWATFTPEKHNCSSSLLRYSLEIMFDAWHLNHGDIEDIFLLLHNSPESAIEYFTTNVTDNSGICLVHIDQYEELFIGIDTNHNLLSFDLDILDLMASSLNLLKVILCIKSEFLSILKNTYQLNSSVVVEVSSQLSSFSWNSIVNEQALFSGITFQLDKNLNTRLDKVIVDDAIQIPFSLPLINSVLKVLYEMAEQKNSVNIELKYADYESVGGVKGILLAKASSIIDAVSPDTVAVFFENCIGINSDEQPFSKEIFMSEINKFEQPVYELFIAFMRAGLLVKQLPHRNTIKMVHDALLQEWKPLNEWFYEHKEYLQWKNLIEYNFKVWSGYNNKREEIRAHNTIAKTEKRNPIQEIWDGMNQAIDEYKMRINVRDVLLEMKAVDVKFLDIIKVSKAFVFKEKGYVRDPGLKRYINESTQNIAVNGIAILLLAIYIF